MPYKSERIPLPRELDRRVRLSEEQKDEIRHKYETGLYSQRQLAKEYNVSRRLIVFVVHPDRYERAKEQSAQRHREGRYDTSKEEHARIIREHRRYKQGLYTTGKLKDERGGSE